MNAGKSNTIPNVLFAVKSEYEPSPVIASMSTLNDNILYNANGNSIRNSLPNCFDMLMKYLKSIALLLPKHNSISGNQ